MKKKYRSQFSMIIGSVILGLSCSTISAQGYEKYLSESISLETEMISLDSNSEVVLAENEMKSENLADALTSQIGRPHDDSYYLQRLHQNALYQIFGYSSDGGVVQLFDASKWDIHPTGAKKVLYWTKSDAIFIKPSVSWSSQRKYVLYNLSKNQAVEANLLASPLPLGEKTYTIIDIHPTESLILLSDQTVWKVKSDYFSNWLIGQRVLVGVNNHWRDATFPHILINVDLYGNPYRQANYHGAPGTNN